MNDRGDGLRRKSRQNVILLLRFYSEEFGNFTKEGGITYADGGKWNNSGVKIAVDKEAIKAIVLYLKKIGISSSQIDTKRAIEYISSLNEEIHD